MKRATQDFKSFIVNEVHPGASKIGETLDRFKKIAENREIPIGSMRFAMQMMVGLYLGEIDPNELPRLDRSSSNFKALELMDECVHTLLDDGYPDEWIYSAISAELED